MLNKLIAELMKTLAIDEMIIDPRTSSSLNPVPMIVKQEKIKVFTTEKLPKGSIS